VPWMWTNVAAGSSASPVKREVSVSRPARRRGRWGRPPQRPRYRGQTRVRRPYLEEAIGRRRGVAPNGVSLPLVRSALELPPPTRRLPRNGSWRILRPP
jgi:hypothetical protein